MDPTTAAIVVAIWCAFWPLCLIGVLLMNKLDQVIAVLNDIKTLLAGGVMVDPAKLDSVLQTAQAIKDSLTPPAPPAP